MDEFLENYENFRDWLFDLTVITPEEAKLLERIRNKWNNLNLDKVF